MKNKGSSVHWQMTSESHDNFYQLTAQKACIKKNIKILAKRHIIDFYTLK